MTEGNTMGRRARTVGSFVWAVLPLITMGFGTPFVFAYAAIRRRKVVHWIAPAAYLLLLIAMSASVDSSGTA
jgi:hypothetical protein